MGKSSALVPRRRCHGNARGTRQRAKFVEVDVCPLTTAVDDADATLFGELFSLRERINLQAGQSVTGQLADTPTRGLDISRTGQLAD